MAKKMKINYNAIVFERYDETDVTFGDLVAILAPYYNEGIEGDWSLPFAIFIVSGTNIWIYRSYYDNEFVFVPLNNPDVDNIIIRQSSDS